MRQNGEVPDQGPRDRTPWRTLADFKKLLFWQKALRPTPLSGVSLRGEGRNSAARNDTDLTQGFILEADDLYLWTLGSVYLSVDLLPHA